MSCGSFRTASRVIIIVIVGYILTERQRHGLFALPRAWEKPFYAVLGLLFKMFWGF